MKRFLLAVLLIPSLVLAANWQLGKGVNSTIDSDDKIQYVDSVDGVQSITKSNFIQQVKGTTAGTLAAGDDARLPTADEKAGIAGLTAADPAAKMSDLPAGDDLGAASASDVSALFSGTGDYLKSDGTKGTPEGGSGGVSSVFSRTGAITAQSGDYTAAQVGAATAAQGALADTAVQPEDLATVAISGAYADLIGKPRNILDLIASGLVLLARSDSAICDPLHANYNTVNAELALYGFGDHNISCDAGFPPLTPGGTVTLSGLSGTGYIGSLGMAGQRNVTATFSGIAGTGALASIGATAPAGGDATATLAGIAGTGSLGTLGVYVTQDGTVTIAGLSGTGAIGTLAATAAAPTVTWTLRTSGTTKPIYGIAYSATHPETDDWLYGSGASSPVIGWSATGSTWTPETAPFFAGSENIFFVNKIGTSWIFGGGVTGAGRVVRWYDDGEEMVWGNTTVHTNSITDMATNGTRIVIVGNGGYIGTSDNGGASFTSRSHGFGTSNINGIGYNGSDTWIAVGAGGLLGKSTDNGVTWVMKTSSFGATNIAKVAFGADLWVAVGTSGKIATSTDNGETWANHVFGVPSNLYPTYMAVEYLNSVWMIGGYDIFATSPTAASGSWTFEDVGFGSSDVLSMGYGNGVWTVGGAAGEIATSTR